MAPPPRHDRRPQGLRASLLAVALVAALPSHGGAVDLSGEVRSARGEPLADAIVFVLEAEPGAALPTPAPSAVMDQINKQFVPRVLPVAVGTAVTFPNHDQIHHHVYSFSPAKTFEIPLYKDEPARPVVFDRPGAVTLGCNIHEWMRAVVLVVPTALFARTDADGRFTLHGVPRGRHRLAVWHERARGGIEDRAQVVEVGPESPPLTFTLEVRRPRAGGGRERSRE